MWPKSQVEVTDYRDAALIGRQGILEERKIMAGIEFFLVRLDRENFRRAFLSGQLKVVEQIRQGEL